MPPSKFKARPHKQKAKAEAAALRVSLGEQDTSNVDANAVEHVPIPKSERDERREQIRAELAAHENATSKTSSKKRKRLDKYIETKLRKDERADLIRKLESQKIDTSLLQSAKKLGRVTESRREAAGRALRERRAGLSNGAENDGVLFQRAYEADEDGIEFLKHATRQPDAGSLNPSRIESSNPQAGGVFGAGLKQPFNLDETGNPIIKIRERKRVRKGPSLQPVSAPGETESWEGFSDGSDMISLPPVLDSDSEENTSASAEPSDGSLSSSAEESDDEGTEGSEDEENAGNATAASGDDRKARASAFTAWASQQRNNAIGFVPSTSEILESPSAKLDHLTQQTASSQKKYVNHVDTKPGLPALKVPKNTSIFNIKVDRSPDIQQAREKLPIVAEEQKIMEAIQGNDTSIIWGATGSGKTTQVPQFLYEAGFGDSKGPNPGMIGVTQPRRVAAVSMAKRVAAELGNLDERVSHQIRFNSTVNSKTAIKFMTDGVLLREIAQDFTLSKYSVVVIDEAHERSVNTDILIGMLSRIVDTRAKLALTSSKHKPLKLIIMSATLRIADFTQNSSLFPRGPPPLVQAEGRQFPVTIHFARRTQRDYVEEGFLKLSRAHRKLPPGGILVFLTGLNEISQLSRKLKETFAATEGRNLDHLTAKTSVSQAVIEDGDIEMYEQNSSSGSILGDEEGANSDAEDDPEFVIENEEPADLHRIHVLPLYSQLPSEQQMRVFEPAPEGSRMIVLATNVAETSLTIPGIRYVFDCGRAKEKQYNKNTGVQSFEVGWISKASASQRAGRAGRTGPGHCYRLYSSAVYERDFAEFSEPEILRTPIEGVVLQLKSMGIPRINNFPFPTPPDTQSLIRAEKLLNYLGALWNGSITHVGRDLSVFPLSPRLSRILVMSQRYGCAEYAFALVAALSVQEIFVPESALDLEDRQDEEEHTQDQNRDTLEREERRKRFRKFHANAARLDRTSDAIKLLTIMLDFLEDQRWGPVSSDFKTFGRVKALQEAAQLRGQLQVIAASNKPGTLSLDIEAALGEPSSKQVKALRQIVAAGFIDQIAIRADLSPNPPEQRRKPRRAIEVPYLTLFPSHEDEINARLRSADLDERLEAQQAQQVFLHPSSVLAHTSIERLPQYLVYSHLSQSTASKISEAGQAKHSRTRMHPLTPLSPQQIVALAESTPLLEEGKPIGKVEMLERDPSDGSERRACWTLPFLRDSSVGAGGLGWPLPPARKVIQKRLKGRGWVFDKLADSA